MTKPVSGIARWLTLYLWVCSGLTLAAFWLIWYYAWKNTSGHTGVPLSMTGWFFLFMAATGLVTRSALGKSLNARRPARLLILCGSLGALFPSFLTHFHILSPYETWLKAGQPPFHAQREDLLVAYLSLVGLAVLVALLKPLHPVSDHTPDTPTIPSQTPPTP